MTLAPLYHLWSQRGGGNDSCNFGPFRVGSVKSPLIVALVTA